MKKNALRRNAFDFLLILFLVVSGSFQLMAQDEKTKTLEKTFDGKTAIWISHRYGQLDLKRGTGSQIKVVLTIHAKGNDDKEVQQFLDKFDLNAVEGPDNKVDIKTTANIKTWNVIGTRSTIKFQDGASFSGIKDFDMHLEVYVPKLRYATLDNAYETTTVEDGTTDLLEIKQYEGRFDAPGTFETVKLDVKYTKGVLGNFTNGEADVYDSDITFGNAEMLKMKSKYSGYKIGKIDHLDIDAYDDNYQIDAVKGTLKIEDKYSEFTLNGNIGNAEMTLYESKIDAQNGVDIGVFNSKYSTFRFKEINGIYFKSSYEDKVSLAKVGMLSADVSKYSKFETDGLWGELKFPSSYEDAIVVHSVGGTFKGLTIDGKYSNVTLPIPAAVKYELDADMQYGKISYAEGDMETTSHIEKNDKISLKAKSKGAGSGAAKVLIKTYEGKIKLD